MASWQATQWNLAPGDEEDSFPAPDWSRVLLSPSATPLLRPAACASRPVVGPVGQRLQAAASPGCCRAPSKPAAPSACLPSQPAPSELAHSESRSNHQGRMQPRAHGASCGLLRPPSAHFSRRALCVTLTFVHSCIQACASTCKMGWHVREPGKPAEECTAPTRSAPPYCRALNSRPSRCLSLSSSLPLQPLPGADHWPVQPTPQGGTPR